MHTLTPAHEVIWAIAALAALGVMIRPWGLPEATWAVAGALLLPICSLLTPSQAWTALARGTNVYLFLIGMMLLAELAREQGLFGWLAARAARQARGSPRRLFALVYAVGVVVTVLLSNDATAVVLTPAVYAVARAAQARPLPYLFICAFIANAASFARRGQTHLVSTSATGSWRRYSWEFGLPTNHCSSVVSRMKSASP